jgi:hypothetical protein
MNITKISVRLSSNSFRLSDIIVKNTDRYLAGDLYCVIYNSVNTDS